MKKQALIIINLIMLILPTNKTFSYAYLPDDVPLNKALIIVSHNGPMAKKYGWLYYQQLGKIEDQWKAGSRGVKTPIMWRKPLPTSKPYIALCHEPDPRNNCDLTLLQRGIVRGVQKAESFFRSFAKLLKDNPDDIAIIFLEDYLDSTSKKSGTDGYTKEKIDNILHDVLTKSGLAQYALKLPASCYSQVGGKAENWPTIGVMRKTGKRLVIFTKNSERAKRSPILNDTRATFKKTTWEINVLEEIKSNKCTLDRVHRGSNAFIVEHKDTSSIPKGSSNANVLGIVKKLGIVVKGAGETDYKKVNSKNMILTRVDQCQKLCGMPPSILFLDMVEIGNANDAVFMINQQRFPKVRTLSKR